MRSCLIVGLYGAALVLVCGCEEPQVGSPGLEPPRPREPGVVDGGADPLTPGSMTGAGRGGSGMDPTTGPNAGSGAGMPPVTAAPDGGETQTSDAAAEPDADSGAPREDNPLFLGLWVVDQPSHALYEATLYELLPGGELVEHDTDLAGGAPPYDGYVTGTVANADSSVRCDFRGSWTSDGVLGLELGSECTDGAQRLVQLSFPATDPAAGLVPTVENVGGENGWEHRDWPWSWRKCPNRSECLPF